MPLIQFFTSISVWSLDWACSLGRRQAAAHRLAWSEGFADGPATALGLSGGAWQAGGAHAGFDLIRAQYGLAVQAGLIERSLLASAALERRLALLERTLLGPWARRT